MRQIKESVSTHFSREAWEGVLMEHKIASQLHHIIRHHSQEFNLFRLHLCRALSWPWWRRLVAGPIADETERFVFWGLTASCLDS